MNYYHMIHAFSHPDRSLFLIQYELTGLQVIEFDNSIKVLF